MKMSPPKNIIRLVSLSLCLLLLLNSGVLNCAAAEKDKETVTVAYIDYNDFIVRNADGTYTGYAADYLQQISTCTGWNYKFVDMAWPEAYEAVKAGKIDFYCVAGQTEERQADFDFSLYPLCSEEMNLYTLPESAIYYEDYQAFNGMKIGMLESSGEIDAFRQYAAANDFDYTLVEYPMNEDAVQALQEGEVDAIALVNYSVSGSCKLVGNFGVAPAYLMSCDGSRHMEEFSAAQERLYFADPSFAQKLEQVYYGESRQHADPLLTREEAACIAASQPLTVALSQDMAPIEYYVESAQAYKGVTVDIYNRISELSGLQFKFVHREDTPLLIKQMENNEVQLIGALAQSANVAATLQITQSRAFSENSMSLVTKDMAALTADSVAAVPAGYPQFKNMARQEGYSNFREYGSFEECVHAVSSGEAELTYIISMCENYLLDHVQYADLLAMISSNSEYGICLGVANTADELLLSVINKCLSVIPTREVNEIIVSNTALAEPQQSTGDFMARNGTIILLAGMALVALIAWAFIRNLKSRQQRALDKGKQQQHSFLQHLYDTLPCGIFQYRYEQPHNILNCNAACARIYGYASELELIGKTPDCVVKKSTAQDFLDKFALCEQTAGHIMYVWPIVRSDGSEGYTECVMDIVETEQGKVFQEVFIDVTERTIKEKLVEQRYLQELNRSGQRDASLLYTACFDITDQVLIATDIDVPGIHAGMTVDQFIAGLQFELQDLQTAEEMADFDTRFSFDRLENDYANGRYEQSFNLCRYKNGQIQWLRSELALRHNPSSGHLMCFDYIRDITDEQVTNEIMRRLAFADCDSFMSVFMSTGRCLQYEADKCGELSRTETIYGQTDVIRSLADNMTADEAEKFLQATALSVVAEQLAAAPHYQLYATLADQKGVRQDKALTYFYTNEENGVLAVTITDVTEVRASEVRHAQLLSDALAAAERADAAKSQFLSRVSHEMRTPLNAIIGFIELAKGADREQMANYLASTDLAARQLLNVINDVLDMSSIEAGKLQLANSSFNFRHLISSLTNIYGTQCKQKGVSFETRISTPVEDWLVGDELRVNQILMNLLGNALKFTASGHIWLTISETVIDEDRLFLRFVVADTGCGMSAAMQERLFKPFEQESAATARQYGGSGLGLSIVKNLVSMMDGVIRVESTQGVGSTFTVDLPFRKSEVGPNTLLPQTIDSLRILAVDDEVSEREYLSLVLKRLGVRFTCVASGSAALTALEKADQENDIYNVCLIDWRMPEMNGIDTTSQIRQKYGKDVVVIVVSAYDFQQAGDSARQAGANLFLSKPIFQSALFDLFMTLTGGKIAQPQSEPQAWDFAGKRVLLVEDNILNQFVAKGYLAKCNIVVELAENGQIAVDMFTASARGYYDAILMDIQMPVMDGFAATKAIRESAHPEAKTIQIIAQTADAFNEDISKSLSAGMNAHVAKPIEPDILSKALYKAFSAAAAADAGGN